MDSKKLFFVVYYIFFVGVYIWLSSFESGIYFFDKFPYIGVFLHAALIWPLCFYIVKVKTKSSNRIINSVWIIIATIFFISPISTFVSIYKYEFGKKELEAIERLRGDN